MSMIISRKHIILAALVLALGTAIFLNWKFSSANGGFNVASVFNTSSSLGDTAYVSSNKVNPSADSYFAQARLSRQQTVDKAEEQIKTALASSTLSTTDKQQIQASVTDLANTLKTEMVIENLIKAKGFTDCVAFINNGSVDIVIKPKTGSDLTSAEAAQVKDIVIQQTKVAAGNLKIIPSK